MFNVVVQLTEPYTNWPYRCTINNFWQLENHIIQTPSYI